MINNLRTFINEKMAMCQRAINTNYTNNVLKDYWTGYKNALKEIDRWYNEQLALETQKICEESIKNAKGETIMKISYSFNNEDVKKAVETVYSGGNVCDMPLCHICPFAQVKVKPYEQLKFILDNMEGKQ